MAVVLECRGELEPAIARYGEAAEVALLVGEAAELPSLSARAAVLALRLGDDVLAAARAEEAARRARASRQEPWALVASAIQSALAIRAHPEATYVPAIVRAIERLEARERLVEAALAVEMLSLAHDALGDRPAAVRTLERARSLAARAGFVSYARVLRERAE